MYAVPSVLHLSESPKGLEVSLHKAAMRTSGTLPILPAVNVNTIVNQEQLICITTSSTETSIHSNKFEYAIAGMG